MKRTLIVALAVLTALVVAPSATAHANEEQGPNVVYFEQTGHYLGGDFLGFWREYGGIRTFGYPLTPEFEQDGMTVQYFERHVLEYHPNNPDDYRVLLRRLGVEARDARGLSGQSPFQADSEGDSGRFFPQTQQNMKDGFLDRWEANGSTRIYGYPISSQFGYNGAIVQFTERAVFEFHPDNPSGWRILTERLGAEAAERDSVDITPQEHDGDTPQYHEDLWQSPEPEPEAQSQSESLPLPSQIRIDRIGVTAPFEHVSRTPAGVMEAPHGWNNVAWFAPGTVPGGQGNAVVAGHLDAPGGVPAIFWNLNQLRQGDHVSVITEAGNELVFQVTGVEQFHVYNAPTSRIFGRTDERNMNLITCAGSWDHSLGMYDQRIVVYTTLVGN